MASQGPSQAALRSRIRVQSRRSKRLSGRSRTRPLSSVAGQPELMVAPGDLLERVPQQRYDDGEAVPDATA